MAVQISGNDITVPRDTSVTRNLTVGGVLTYEDVTNVDSVGLVTARSGIEIGARPGVAASISVDGNMIISGISTFGGDVQVPDKIIHSGDTNTAIRFPSADTITAETGGSERARIDSTGRVRIGCTAQPSTTVSGTQFDAGGKTLRISEGGGTSSTTGASVQITGGGSNTSIGAAAATGAVLSLTNCNNTDNNQTSVEFSASSGLSIAKVIGKNDSHSSRNGSLIFLTSSGAAPAERARITSDGLFGIGTDAPTSKLYVNGLSTADVITARAADSNGNSVINIISEGTTGNSRIKFSDTAGTDGQISYSHDARALIFAAGGTTERLRIDDAGKFRFAVTNVQIELQTSDGSDNGFLNLSGGGACSQGRGAQVVCFGNDYSNYEGTLQLLAGQSGNTNGVIQFYTSGSEVARIDNEGGLRIGNTTSNYDELFTILEGGTNNEIATWRVNNASHTKDLFNMIHVGSSAVMIRFRTTGSLTSVGTITCNSSSTTYGTSSDYRLKENEVLISDGITRLKQLKPYTFNFKVTPDQKSDGFFAHEAQEVVPYAVKGEKDAEDTQVMDYGKLTPLLTAALQEAVTEIESLKARLDAAGL